jgi:2-methylcitrate dehydratase PrpD
VRRLTQHVRYELDPDSAFPRTYDGEVEVRTRDGRVLRHREPFNRGSADRPLTQDEIEAKFFDNAAHAVSADKARQIRDHLLGLDDLDDAGALGKALARSQR